MPSLQRHVDTANASAVILGAGLAGLSLADALLAQGVTSPITLVDAREEFSEDRTWCFWDVHQHPYRHLIAHRWANWSFSRRGVTCLQHSAAMPYCHIPSASFYDDVLSRVRAAPNCTLSTSVTIETVVEGPGEVRVATSHGEIVADYAFDALATAGPTWAATTPDSDADALGQHFLGWFVEAAHPVFEPSCVTLMDFDVTATGQLRFMYVLPFSSTSALVEDTTIGFSAVPPEASRAEIAQYLEARYGLRDFTVSKDEHAVLPMLIPREGRRQPTRVIPVGTAAGAVRPSSGYGFIRTLRQVAQLAKAFAAGNPSPVPVGRRRDAELDRIFLEALSDDPAAFADQFMSLGRRMTGDRLARFMMDAATPLDIAAMIAALPKGRFARAAARSARAGGRQ